jgi:hypothetical protein
MFIDKSMQMLINQLIISKKKFVVIFSVLIFIIQYPFYVAILSDGIDPSWLLGLKWASLKGLVFGRDIAFTYGPLYFLNFFPVNFGHYPSLLLEEFIFWIVSFAVILLVVYQFAGLIYKKPWKDYSAMDGILIILGLAFFAFLPLHLPETILVLNCLLFTRLIFEIEYSKANKKKYLSNILLNATLFTIVCLIKFSYTTVALVIIFIALIGLIYQRKAKFILYIIPSFIIIYLVSWVLCGQALSALPGYFYYGFELSSGYTEALMKSGLYYELNYGLFAFIVLLFTGISSLFFFIKKDFYSALILFFTLPLLFMAFKEGFVRADGGDNGHFIHYFLQLFPILLFLLIFMVEKPSFRYKTAEQLLLICILSIATAVIIRHYQKGEVKKYPLAKLYFKKNHVLETKKLIQEAYPALPEEFLQQAKNKTVDIFPWDISLLYAYDLDWIPRPVMQSSAYTPVLDRLNASHFEKNNAPDNIIYTYQSLDNHYLLFDDPAVFRTLLKNYKTQSQNDDYLILQRRQEKTNSDSIPVGGGSCPIGTLIDVPQRPGQHVYCNIDISIHFGGKLISLLYRPAFISIYFYIKGQIEPVEYGYVRRMGADGLFVSKYAADLSDVYCIFEGDYEQDIEKIKIEVKGNSSYESDMKYEFYAVPIEK